MKRRRESGLGSLSVNRENENWKTPVTEVARTMQWLLEKCQNIHTLIYSHRHIYARMHTNIYIHIFDCIYMREYIHTYAPVYTHIHIHICSYVCADINVVAESGYTCLDVCLPQRESLTLSLHLETCKAWGGSKITDREKEEGEEKRTRGGEKEQKTCARCLSLTQAVT